MGFCKLLTALVADLEQSIDILNSDIIQQTNEIEKKTKKKKMKEIIVENYIEFNKLFYELLRFHAEICM